MSGPENHEDRDGFAGDETGKERTPPIVAIVVGFCALYFLALGYLVVQGVGWLLK